MGDASLTGYHVRRTLRFRLLQWRTERNRDTAVRYLDLLAVALEGRGWRCVKTYRPEVVPVRTPLLRVYGADRAATTFTVVAVPGGGWAFHEAPRGRGGFLCQCGGDIEFAAQVIDRFLRDRPL
ncbi:hypothetical protein E1264_37920 [Actinomadura sp. KC216]|uniref:hypothetical protein n=1 Tax=Actinomadura sp. KC216 TaxID=2530370 RepID=UPI001048CACB|nr:hypothetical protein [Actinomadura sp. KC216]TDB76910.1 hypothetical protein E1264_37920 [Actinomadura sp. KC216]